MTDDDKKQVSAMVEPELHEEVKRLGHGEITRTIRQALRDRVSTSTEYELEQARKELADVEDEMAGVETDIKAAMDRLAERVNRHNRLAERKSELAERVDTLETEVACLETEREEKRDDVLDELTDKLREGTRLFPSHSRVREAAKALGENPEDILEMMKERHPDVPEHAFVMGTETEKEWHGLDEPDEYLTIDHDEITGRDDPRERYPSLVETEEE